MTEHTFSPTWVKAGDKVTLPLYGGHSVTFTATRDAFEYDGEVTLDDGDGTWLTHVDDVVTVVRNS